MLDVVTLSELMTRNSALAEVVFAKSVETMFWAIAESPDGEPAVCWLVVAIREKSGTHAKRATSQSMTITRLCLVTTLARLSKSKRSRKRRFCRR
jgi:hypothetical protein